MNAALIKKISKSLVFIYLFYAVVLAIVPYALPKPISKENLSQLKTDFYALPERPSPDRVGLVETTDDAFVYRMQLLSQAEESIDIVYHTIRPGVTTDYFFAQVLEMADQGVKVRFLVDAKVGGMNSGEKKKISYALHSHPNVEFRVFNRLHLLTPWRWNTLLHDKFIIIDNTYLLSGGRNIGDIYFDPPGHTGRVSNDRDILLYNTGETASSQPSIIDEAKEYMELLWNHELSVPRYSKLSSQKFGKGQQKRHQMTASLSMLSRERPDVFDCWSEEDMVELTVPTKGVHMLVNPVTGNKKEPWVAYQVAQMALQAQHTAVIQTPYATANKDLLAVMTQMGNNVDDFQMLTNSLGSSPNFPAFSNYYSQRKKFLATGASIYEFQNVDHSIHAKSYQFDQRLSVVGSLNLDDRSFYIDTETVFVVDSPEFYYILRETIQGYQEESLVVGPDNRYIENPDVKAAPVSTVKQGLMWVVSIFSRLFQFLI